MHRSRYGVAGTQRRTTRCSRTHRMAALLAIVISTAAIGCSGAGSGAPVQVVVPQGSTFRAAAESLSAKGVIGNVTLFRTYAKIRGADRRIKAGTYVLRPKSGWAFVVDALQEGKGAVHTITIPEGFALSQIVPLIASTLRVPEDSVIAAVRDTALLRRLDVPTETLEGYLFPDTYSLLPGTPARAAVRTMVQRFENQWRPEWSARLDTVTLSRHDVVTLASIVEREAKLREERPVIAAVYMNRLRDGMLLQADPTVQYARGTWAQRLYFRDLEVDSPYNTYRVAGLPPGPIASPGAASLEAVLYPADAPYKFFVAFPDGHHEFRRTYTEHLEAVRAARRAWDQHRR
jgi:UPF0755 protein